MSLTGNGGNERRVNPSGRIIRRRGPSYVENIHRRVRLAFFLIVLMFLSVAGELFHIQVNLNRYYAARASGINIHTTTLSARRGRILDRNGMPLAVDLHVADIVADPTLISDPNATAAKLANLFNGIKPVNGKTVLTISPTDLAASIFKAKATVLSNKHPLRYLLIAPAIPYQAELAFDSEMKQESAAHRHDASAEIALSGVSVCSREARSYPNGDLGAQILGFVTGGPVGTPDAADLKGHLGIEGHMDATLSGTSGSITAEQDAFGHVISYAHGEIKPAKSGQDVTLTIDSAIQRIAQNELNTSCEKFKAQMGTVVVIDPSNGDILALASNPTFDPNRPGDASPTTWMNPAISTLYEPGSTMKTLTLSAVMDAHGVESQYMTVTCKGSLKIGNHTIHCAVDPPTYGHHGTETMREVMENSCNIGAYLYAKTIGAETLFEYERRFGILDKPNSGLPFEQYCRLQGPEDKNWPQIELANIAFGQGLSLTPLQVASVYATIANNGVVVHPHILLGQGYSGQPQIAVKPEVAQTMMSFLQSVVQKGTGQPAQLSGYTIGGKTGSAQVFENGRYGNNFVGSFVGIAPLNHPRLVILCAIFKPQGMHWGAVVAAPVVRNIAAQSLRYLRIPQDDSSPALAYNQTPDLSKSLASHKGTSLTKIPG